MLTKNHFEQRVGGGWKMTEDRLNLNLHPGCQVGGRSQKTGLAGAAIGQHHVDIRMEGTA